MNELDFAETIIEEQEIAFEPVSNNHFVEVDEQNRIVKGWSDAFAPATENSIVINEQGGYQFRLWPEGEENPNLFTIDGVPLYKWDGQQVIARDKTEIEADRAAMPKQPAIPTYEERLAAMESAMLIMAMVLGDDEIV